ncbi:MAG: CapA family protein [Prevotella sp.]
MNTGSGKSHDFAVSADSVEKVEDSVCIPLKKDCVTIAMVGDIMMGTTYPETLLPPDEGRMLFRDVKTILQNADLAAGNLEGTLSDTGRTTKKKSAHSYAFRTPIRYAERLKEVGFDFLGMANNHIFDFGLSGVISTEEALRRLDIAYAGIKGRSSCSIVERNGVRYGLCAFGHNGYTLQHNDLPTVKNILDKLRSCTDIVVVSFHGGGEGKSFSHLPYGKETFLNEDRGSLRKFAHFCIDNGADVVFGHGPHVVRCVELYNNRFIAYSLGNFCTPYGISIAGVSGFAPVIEAKLKNDGSFVSGKIHSFIQKRGLGPRRDSTNSVVKQIRTLTATDIPEGRLLINSDGEILIK